MEIEAPLRTTARGPLPPLVTHGWMQDRADPHARERAFEVARQDPPPGVSPQAPAVAIADVLDSIGDTCPECPTDENRGRGRTTAPRGRHVFS
jgi:hypothetical protein